MHTGPHNYHVEAGDVKVQIDGYGGTTILEAKHVGKPSKSPFVPSSSISDKIRTVILGRVRKQLTNIGEVIASGSTPFTSLEIITNSKEAKTLFESMLKELGVPGMVRWQP